MVVLLTFWLYIQIYEKVIKSALESVDELRSRVDGGDLCVGLGAQVGFVSFLS